MIMRFLDIDVSQLSGSTATWSSRIGDDSRVVLGAITGESTTSPAVEVGTDWDGEFLRSSGRFHFLTRHQHSTTRAQLS